MAGVLARLLVLTAAATAAATSSLGQAAATRTVAEPEAEPAEPAEPAVDVGAVAARFQAIDARVAALRSQLAAVQRGVTCLEEAAKEVAGGVSKTLAEVRATSAAAEHNIEQERAIKARYAKISEQVAEAGPDITAMQKVINGLWASAVEMGSQSASIGKKVVELQQEVKKTLPGAGNLAKRVSRAEARVRKYQQEAASGIDAAVAGSLRAHFRRATARVHQLADEEAEALKAQ